MKMAMATSFTKGDVIKKAKVTPSGMPPFTKPINNEKLHLLLESAIQNNVKNSKLAKTFLSNMSS